MKGLVKWFNEPPERMLWKYAAENRADWLLWLPFLLFEIWEVVQASVGFFPF